MIKRTLQVLCMLAVLLISNTFLFAACFERTGKILEQPDKSQVPVVVNGDEFYGTVETPDGHTLIEDEKGWICYAKLNATKTALMSTGIIYSNKRTLFTYLRTRLLAKHIQVSEELQDRVRCKNYVSSRASRRSFRALPDSGALMERQKTSPKDIVALTLLVDFPDVKSATTKTSVDTFLNGASNSVRAYFRDVSGGKVDYTNIVLGYYTAKFKKAYYTDSCIAFGTRARELVTEALTYWKAQGFDFAVLSPVQAGGAVVNVLYAGGMGAYSAGLWPHQSQLLSLFYSNGTYIRKYQISDLGSAPSIQTFCHESGHLLFNWPDLYDVTNKSRGVGSHCLMGRCINDEANPVTPCLWLRWMEGWARVINVSGISGSMPVVLKVNSLTGIVYKNVRNMGEFWLLEARRRVGRNQNLPSEGLYIWHVDACSGSNDRPQGTCNEHYTVALMQADGRLDLEHNKNSGDSTDAFQKNTNSIFSGATQPAAFWWCSGEAPIMVSDIGDISSEISFNITLNAGQTTPTTYVIDPVKVNSREIGVINPQNVR